MRKFLSVLLVLCLMISSTPMVFAAGSDVTIKADKTAAKNGEDVTVTVTFPAVSGGTAYSASVAFTYDESAFKVKSFTAPSYNGTASNGNNTASGNVSCTYMGNMGENTIDCSSELNLAVVFEVIDSAAAGSYDFVVDTDATFAKHIEDDGYTETELVTVPSGTKVTVDIVSELSSVTVSNLDAPAKGTDLDTEAAYAVGGGTPEAVAVSWYEGSAATGTVVSGQAKAKQVYTAKITIAAPTGYKFADSVTVDGYTVTRDSDTQISVTKTFPETSDKTLTGIAVTTDPTKTAYTHGDTLDTAGMAVTATYDDASTAPVADYTVSYAAGSYLKKGDTAATVAFGGKTADVTGLTVEAKELTVEGLKATDREYDAASKAVVLSGGELKGVLEGETVTATMPTSGEMADPDTGTDKPVTFAPITLSGADAANYTIKQPEVTVTITGKDISGAVINLGTQAVYDGTEKDVVITSVTLDGAAFSDYTIKSGGKATNVEETTLVIEGKGSYSGTVEAKWTLQKATPTAADFTITAPTATDYTGEPIEVAAPTTTKTGMGEVTVKYDPEGHTDAGDYTVTFDVAEGDNYKAATGFAIGTLTINTIEDPATITETAGVEPNSSIDLSANVSGAEGAVSYAISGEALGCTVDAATGEFTSGADKGTVKVTVTIADSKNCSGKTAEITVTIADKVATPVLSEETQTFTGTLEVTISCETTGAAIHYTLNDGADEIYTSGSAITISADTVLKAYATMDGYLDSDIVEATYTKKSSGGGGGGGGSTKPADTTEPEDEFPFTDVPEDAYFRKPVEWALKNGITSGNAPAKFGPYDVTTRGQMITFLWIAKGSPEPTGTTNPFKDVAEGAYYYKAVLWAYENGITAGVSEDAFAPDQAVTRAQAATFLYGVAGRPAAGSEPFVDVESADYFADPVAWAYNNGITAGTSAGHFSPDAACLRAQIITFMALYFAE